jgi:pimeloyl-ACP methyl ester carboxylesterase
MKLGTLLILSLFQGSHLLAVEVATIHLPPPPNMDRADLNYVVPLVNPKAVLILSPGCNGSAESLARSPIWQEFAHRNHLALVGLSFASPEKAIHDGTGYYYASKGSGDKLLEGIRKIYGKDLPLLLYGFSGGAHFTSRFEEWAPSRVIAWCADSAGWWDEPKPSGISPPGIVACGQNDPRYGASLGYFKQGRAAGKPWLWVSLPKIGHQASPALEEFARKYFEAVLRRGGSSALSGGVWVDVDTKKVITESEAMAVPSESGWLPDPSLTQDWRKIHEP